MSYHALRAFLAMLLITLCACDSGRPVIRTPEFVVAPSVLQPAAAPLAARVDLATDIATRIDITLLGANGHEIRLEYFEFATQHALIVLGLRAAETYDMTVTAVSVSGLQSVWQFPSAVTTLPLPEEFPGLTVRESTPASMSGEYTLLDVRRRDRSYGAVLIIDADGEVVWYWEPAVQSETERVQDGRFLTLDGSSGVIQYIDMLGETLQAWHSAQSSDGIDGSVEVDAAGFHHDVVLLPSGNLLTSVRESTSPVPGFPVDENDQSVTDTVILRDEPVIEFDATGAIVGHWPFLMMLKPTRIGFDGTRGLPNRADWVHLNGIWYDERDDTVLASLRHQDAIVKFSRQDGRLIWILGPPANWEGFEQFLLSPAGDEFYWPYHTHAPMVTRSGTILLFDNSNYQASPFTGVPKLPPAENFSRAVEFSIDELGMTVEQVWEYGFRQSGEKLYASFVGDADELTDSDNVLITFGGLCTTDGLPSENSPDCRSSARIIEVSRSTNDKVFDLEVVDSNPDTTGYIVYRSERLQSLADDAAVRITRSN